MPKRSLYKILELKDGASIAEVKKAYRKLSLKYHPDSNKGDKSFVDKFIEIDNAYNILSDPIKKAEYDRSRKNVRSQEDISNKQQKPQNRNQRTYSTEDNWRNWRNLKNQHPVVSIVFCYLAFALLIILAIADYSDKDKPADIEKHLRMSMNDQNRQIEERNAKVRSLINDEAKQVYEVIEYPRIIQTDKPELCLYNIELTGSETILSFMYKDTEAKAISVEDNFSLLATISADENLLIKEYKLLKLEKIPAPSKYTFDESDKLSFFQLIFDMIPNDFRCYTLNKIEHNGKSTNILRIDLNHKDMDTQDKLEKMKAK